MFNIKTETKGALTSLVVTADVNSILAVINSASKEYKKILYVTYSRPYFSFGDYFKKNKINPNNFFFIDCITRSAVKKPVKVNNGVFISGPKAFEEIQGAIYKKLKTTKFDVLIFDSLSSLLVYEKEMFVSRFLHQLAAMIKGHNCKAAFVILHKDVDFNFVKTLGMLTDKTIYLI